MYDSVLWGKNLFIYLDKDTHVPHLGCPVWEREYHLSTFLNLIFPGYPHYGRYEMLNSTLGGERPGRRDQQKGPWDMGLCARESVISPAQVLKWTTLGGGWAASSHGVWAQRGPGSLAATLQAPLPSEWAQGKRLPTPSGQLWQATGLPSKLIEYLRSNRVGLTWLCAGSLLGSCTCSLSHSSHLQGDGRFQGHNSRWEVELRFDPGGECSWHCTTMAIIYPCPM